MTSSFGQDSTARVTTSAFYFFFSLSLYLYVSLITEHSGFKQRFPAEVLGHCPEPEPLFFNAFFKRDPEVLCCSIQADDLGQTCFLSNFLSLMTWYTSILGPLTPQSLASSTYIQGTVES